MPTFERMDGFLRFREPIDLYLYRRLQVRIYAQTYVETHRLNFPTELPDFPDRQPAAVVCSSGRAGGFPPPAPSLHPPG